MTIYIFLFGVLLSAGLFFITADLLRLPTLATQKAMLSAGKQAKAKPKATDALLRNAAVQLSRYLRMDEYKKSRMENVLSAAGLSDSPELFTAMAIVKAMSIALCIIPCLIVLPLLNTLVCLRRAGLFKEIRKADEALAAKRGKIERNCPASLQPSPELKPAGMCCPCWRISREMREKIFPQSLISSLQICAPPATRRH